MKKTFMNRFLFCFLFLFVSLYEGFGQITYQWLKDGVEIKGATNEKFKPLGSGNYSVRITNQNNCTSEVSSPIAYKCFNEITPVISKLNEFELKSSVPVVGETYQWFLDNVLIVGANSSSYKAYTTGVYTLQTKDANGCFSAVSAAIAISILGIEKENLGAAVFPNPFTAGVKITFGEEFGKEVSVSLFDMKGALVYTKSAVQMNEMIDLSKLSEGTYLLRMEAIDKENKVFFKMIKQL